MASIGVSLVIPTYNESRNLPALFAALRGAMAASPVPWEVILADDSSPDGTAGIARGLAMESQIPLRAFERHGPRSLSASVTAGAALAKFDVAVVLDADLSHDPTQVFALAKPVLDGAADVVAASRYAAGGAIQAWPVMRRVLSLAGTYPARVLTGIRDPLSGYFACRRELLAATERGLQPRGFKILLEILGRTPGLRVLEVPTCFTNRTMGRSKLRLRQKLEFLAQLASLAWARFFNASDLVRDPTKSSPPLQAKKATEALASSGSASF